MNTKTPAPDNLMTFASRGALVFSGSLIAISIALRVVGLDFAPLMQAMTQNVAEQMKTKSYETDVINDLEARIEVLEQEIALLKPLAHKPNKGDY